MSKYKISLWLYRLGLRLLVSCINRDINKPDLILDEDRTYQLGNKLLKYSELNPASGKAAQAAAQMLVREMLNRVKENDSE